MVYTTKAERVGAIEVGIREYLAATTIRAEYAAISKILKAAGYLLTEWREEAKMARAKGGA